MNKKLLMAGGILSLGLMGNAYAGIDIDTFDDAQSLSITAPGTDTDTVGGGMLGGFRTFFGDTNNGLGNNLDIVSTGLGGIPPGQLQVSNGVSIDGIVEVTWDANGAGLGGIDFNTAGGGATNISINVIGIDLNVAVEFIINGTSSSGVQMFAGPGIFNVAFNSFTDPSALMSVDSVVMRLTGPSAWDGQFDLIGTSGTPPTVPEPAISLLIGTGLLGLVGFRKRKKI